MFLSQNHPASNLPKSICDVIHPKLNYWFLKIHALKITCEFRKKKGGTYRFLLFVKRILYSKTNIKEMCSLAEQLGNLFHIWTAFVVVLIKQISVRFSCLRAAGDQRILRILQRLAKFPCDLTPLSQMVNIRYFLVEGFLHTVHSYYFFLHKIGNVVFFSYRVNILSRSEN